MTLQDCFVKGQLKKSPSDIGKAKSSLKIAENKLNAASIQIENSLYDWAFIAAYTSMFHSARALLFKDGIKERSHFCLFLYVKETYRGKIEAKYLHELDILREQRHAIFYGDEDVHVKEVRKVEAESAVSTARGFLEVVKKLIV
ncbi:HEPN domain-containing protein [Candidatus Micrarchaeota archaeon]|nr:HEPN domain-containing protein [Candidatus Micrarchaeota archaeon]